MRRTSILAVTGLTAIAAAATLRFVVVPAQAQLPADTDTTRTYQGVIDVMLDPAALAAGDLGNVMVRDLPITIERNIAVTDVADGVATVAESAVVSAPDGSTVLASDASYLVDRRTMLAQGDRSGLVIGWPIGTEAVDQRGWSTDLQAEVDLVHTGTQVVDGIDALVFESDFTGRIVDPETLALFPASLPKFVLPLITSVLDLSDEAAANLAAAAPLLPTDVTLGYWLTSTTTYLVDPTTGIVLDVDRIETRQVGLDVEGIPAAPIADVFTMRYQGTDASVADAVAEAKAAAGSLALFGTTLPLVLTMVGLVLLALAVRGRRNGGRDDQLVVLEPRESALVGA